MAPLRSVPLVKSAFKIWATARGATYRTEAELTNEVATRLPEPEELRVVNDIDIQVRSKASPPWLSEFYSRQVLASVDVELDDDAPPYDIPSLQGQLRDSEIPVVQLFSKRTVEKGDLGINERVLASRRDDSAFVVLIELGSDIGKMEQWIRDFDMELLRHLRGVDNELTERFNPEQYDHGEWMGTNITAHLNRTSRKNELDCLISRAEEIENVTVFRRSDPNWYLERVGGSDRPSDKIISGSHRLRLDDWRDGVTTEEIEFQNCEPALQWLRGFIEDPVEAIESKDSGS
jgi:hypothetical protein